ncbi:hypothetical protein [Paractinoplanes hotanensis]|uniref:Uncharacterized protein n=1 Tax=Paractinoplanes hotanensis TaxID=2906497 RepID=A0ABT0XRR9_9ACTN|nr:hypothetical protein [Actinoplanes hotanensis]MCM4076365.1 hypothetical protein [Actinoplanes hotanensis]
MLTGAATSIAAVSSPASAVSGVVERGEVSAYNSVALKQLSVECPPFHSAIGGTASIYGTNQVRILAAVPSGSGSSGSGFGIVASEQETGATANWRIEGTAICAPTASLPGLEYKNDQSAFGSPKTLEAKAVCSPGKHLIGMGGEGWYSSLSDRSQVVLTGIRPNSAGTEVTATGFEDQTGFSGNWRTYATAVCMNPVAGQHPVGAADGFDTDPVKVATPQCPSTEQVHSLGFDITGPSGGGAGETHVHRLGKAGRGASIHAVEDADGLSGSWRLRGYAICAR